MTTTEEYKPSVCEEDLLNYIDEKDLLSLEQKYGGQTIYIYAKPKKELIDTVGEAAAQTLTDVFKTTWVYIPKVLLRHKRNKEIFSKINSGICIEELAAKFKLKTPAIKAMLVKYYGYKVSGKNKG